ncbi:MAG: aminotransferase class V-fold PLP-dependent enzyme [Lewinellaceae bacterium]|nr:aminotransferase class V-fold PLP-dependent enzyme [Saprospiraceae bacterium]MCB9338567.1 aminotransferase class V-fold PLP-dependent enzyme [Lewinellaceae bacterium]
MLTCQKHLFSLPDEISYLNCAYMGPLPKKVEEAGLKGVSVKALPYQVVPEDFFQPVKQLKQLFSQLVDIADPERVAIIPSVSYGMANVVRNVKAEAGQNVVLVGEVFPSNYYAWRRLADEKKLEIRLVNAPTASKGRGAAWNEALLQAIDGQTVAASLPHVHWADGTRFDLAAVRQRTREVGALMVVDGTQSVGAMPFDVETLQPDALICAAYKWMLGPYSLGAAYYGSYFDDGSPVEESWMNRLHSENFQALVNYQPAYKPSANRYGMGESSQFIGVPMFATALEMVMGWGAENIQEYGRRLALPWLGELREMGCQIEDETFRGHHLIGVRLPEGVDLDRFKEKAIAEKVYLSFRGNAIRLSVHLYNEEKDFERLLKAFKASL